MLISNSDFFPATPCSLNSCEKNDEFYKNAYGSSSCTFNQIILFFRQKININSVFFSIKSKKNIKYCKYIKNSLNYIALQCCIE